MLKKIVSVFLTAVILITSLPIIPISEAVNEVVVSQIQKIAAVNPMANVTTYDVTGLVTGADTGHTHIFEGKYDDNNHWQECWICGTKKDIKPHTKTVTGTPGCATYLGVQQEICTEGCGYKKDLPKQEHKLVARSVGWNAHYHTYICTVCNEEVGALREPCVNEKGQILGCSTGIAGTCAICGSEVIANHAGAASDYFPNGNQSRCLDRNCNEVITSYEVQTQVLSNHSVKYTFHTTLAPNVTLMTDNISVGTCNPNPGAKFSNLTWTKNADGTYTSSAVVTYDDSVTAPGKYEVHILTPYQYNGQLVGATHLGRVYVQSDNEVPSKRSNVVTGNGLNVNNYSKQAKITATYTDEYEFNNVVSMRLMDRDKNTAISDWVAATKSGSTYTHTFDVVAEIREASNVYVQVKDACGNTTVLEDGAVNVQYIDAVAPRLIGGKATQTNWSKTKTHTYTTEDKGVGDVQIAFNNQSQFGSAEKSGDIYTRTYNFTGDVTGNVTAALYIKDALGNIRTERVTISNLDNTAPTIDTVQQTLSADKQSVGIQLTANDFCKKINANGSGVAKYAISKTQTQPDASQFQQGSNFTVRENGTYYLWAMDAVGNISEPKQILIKDIEININGTITWNDQNDKYHTRKQTTLKLYRKVGTGTEELAESATVQAGQTEYSFKVRETNDQGQKYTYRVEQGNITGYKTTVSGYNITNDLIIPEYTSEITYTAVDTYNNQYLKNGRVRIKGIVQNTNNGTYPELGVNGTITFVIDNAIALEEGTLTINKVNKTGAKTVITSYSKSGNTITITNETIKAEEKIEIEVVGKATEIKTYTSTINLRGNLRTYNGESTNIDLGELTKAEKQIEVTKQMPKAKIQITKRDSITEEKITNATFTLYEWDGKKYVEKEIIRDDNQDGIYESKYYEWNKTSQGKYKIEETGIPANHTNLNVGMEYTINELKEADYTIKPEYTNGVYRMEYRTRTPDDFDREEGVVENEPNKVKVKIDKIDSETKQQIKGEATFTIYEWNKDKGQYEEYTSKVNSQKVTMARQEDGTYESSQWLYYTQKNEGKYRIIETKAPTGYYGDYKEGTTISTIQASEQANEEINGQANETSKMQTGLNTVIVTEKQSILNQGEKNTYDINIVEILEAGRYENQTVVNGSTINIGNNGEKLENTRVKNKVELTKQDKERNTNKAQGDAKLEQAEYTIYAKENIYHPDGTTTNYEEEPGLLYKAGDIVQSKTTNSEGKITFDNLESGKYYVKETKAPEGYKKDEQTYEIDLTYQNEQQKEIKKEIISKEEIKKQSFQIKKLVKKEETEYEALEGAGFSIYLIKDLKIVKEGKIERQSEDKYILNDEKAQKDTRLTKKKQKDGSYKLSDLIDYYYKLEYKEGEEQELPGDERSYHAYNLSEEEKAKEYTNSAEGKEIEEKITDSEGKIVSPELAYGEYIIIETTTPKEYDTAKPFIVKIEEDSRQIQELRYIEDPNFEAKIKIYKIDEETRKTVGEKEAKYVIRNKETGELVTNNIWTKEEGIIEEGTYEHPYTTGREGYVITTKALGIGKYEIEEVEAPYGYTKNGYEGRSENGETIWERQEKAEIEITGEMAYYTDEQIGGAIKVEKQENKAQVGTIKIETKGDYIQETESKENGETEIKYSKEGIKGAEYQIKAKEKIISQDGQTTLYEEGDIVKIVETNEEGIGYAENLPLGKYIIKQTKAGKGFALNKEEREIEIKYGTNSEEMNEKEGSKEWKKEAEETPVRYYEIKYENERQKVGIEIEKEDEATGEKLKGAIFGIYTKEEIKGKNEETKIEANTKIKEIETNEEGKGNAENLPLGKYYIKEEKAPEGYTLNKEEKEIEGIYEGDQKERHEEKVKYTDERTAIYVEKQDEEGNKLAGATLRIEDEEGNKIIEWETEETAKKLTILSINTKYILKEIEPAKGYVTAKEIEITLDEDGKIKREAREEGETKEEVEEEGDTQEQREDNTIIMQDKTTKVTVKIVDKETQEPRPGVTVEIYEVVENEDGSKEQGEKIGEYETDENGEVDLDKLPIGDYVIKPTEEEKEKEEKEGYVPEEIEIEVEDTEERQEKRIEQEHTKVEVEIEDKETKEGIPGITVEIYEIVEKEDGTKERGEKIGEYETDKDGKIEVDKLPVGKYEIVEKEGQEEKIEKEGYVPAEPKEIEVKATKEKQEAKIEQEHTKVEIEIEDKETKEKLPGITVEIYEIIEKEDGTKERGEKKGEYETDKDGKIEIDKLPVGKYEIVEKEGQEDKLENKGYIPGTTEIEVKATKEKQKGKIEQDYTRITVEVLDKYTREPVIGATIVIEDKDGNEVTKEWISDGKPKQIERLGVGEYYIVEKEAPTLRGYVKTGKQEMEVEKTTKLQEKEYLQEKTKVKLEVKDPETGKKLEDVKVKIKDEKGNVVEEVEKEKLDEVIEQLPVGKYTLEVETNQYGYKNTEVEIEIKETEEVQVKEIKAEREKFDIKIEEWVKTITRNGKEEYVNKKEEQKISKIDVASKKVKKDEIKVRYKLKISNAGKITGEVGKVEVTIPEGMEYKEEDNEKYWEEEGGKIVSYGLKERELKEGQKAELEIVLRWKKGIENFGNKKMIGEIKEVTSDIGFEETDKENNRAEAEVIIGVRTGELNLVYICWILLIMLIITEIVISKKLKIKNFKIKDKTLKYRQ